jgi:hypothetical protein
MATITAQIQSANSTKTVYIITNSADGKSCRFEVKAIYASAKLTNQTLLDNAIKSAAVKALNIADPVLTWI